MTGNKALAIIDLLKVQPTLDSVESVNSWQRRLREATDQAIATAMEPVFNREFRDRYGESLEQKREVSKWANRVLHDAGLCVALPNGRAASFQAISHGINYPKLYFSAFKDAAGDARKHTPYTFGETISLRGLPSREYNISRHR